MSVWSGGLSRSSWAQWIRTTLTVGCAPWTLILVKTGKNQFILRLFCRVPYVHIWSLFSGRLFVENSCKDSVPLSCAHSLWKGNNGNCIVSWLLGGRLRCANCRGHPQQVTIDTKLGGAGGKPGSHRSTEGLAGWRNGPAETYPDIYPEECEVLSLGRTAPAVVCAVHPRAEQAQSVLINVYKHIKAGCKEDGAWLFPVVPSGRIRHCGHKLDCWRVPLHLRGWPNPGLGCSGGLCSLHPWRYFRTWSWVPGAGWLCWAGWNQLDHRAASSLSTSDMVKFGSLVVFLHWHQKYYCRFRLYQFCHGQNRWQLENCHGAGWELGEFKGGFAVVFIVPIAPTHQTPKRSNSTWLGWAQEGHFECLREQHNGSLSSDVCYSSKMYLESSHLFEWRKWLL